MTDLSVGLNMAPIRLSRKQAHPSPLRGITPLGLDTEVVRCGTFPRRCISLCTETETVADRATSFAGEFV